MTKPPVIAAITNYNMAGELERLLPQVLRQGYDEIFVLDDASTDNSREVVEKFKGVTFVAGKTNKGAGSNRNRIISALKHDALIHFLDADVDLDTKNTADLVRKVVPDGPFALIGGLIKGKQGKPHPWNYSNGVGARSSFGSFIQQVTFDNQPPLTRMIRRLFRSLLSDWPDPEVTPKRREIYWCAEANMVVRHSTFADLGGFNENHREIDSLDLAIRAHAKRLKSYFDPTISVRHTEGKVRQYNRNLRKAKEMIDLPKILGFTNWLLHDGRR